MVAANNRIKHIKDGKSFLSYLTRHETQTLWGPMQSLWQKAPHCLHTTMAFRLQDRAALPLMSDDATTTSDGFGSSGWMAWDFSIVAAPPTDLFVATFLLFGVMSVTTWGATDFLTPASFGCNDEKSLKIWSGKNSRESLLTTLKGIIMFSWMGEGVARSDAGIDIDDSDGGGRAIDKILTPTFDVVGWLDIIDVVWGGGGALDALGGKFWSGLCCTDRFWICDRETAMSCPDLVRTTTSPPPRFGLATLWPTPSCKVTTLMLIG